MWAGASCEGMLSLTLSAAPAMSGSWSAGSVIFSVARFPPARICTTSWVASKSVRSRDSGAFSRLSSIESPSYARQATCDGMPRARPRDRTDQAALTPGLPLVAYRRLPRQPVLFDPNNSNEPRGYAADRNTTLPERLAPAIPPHDLSSGLFVAAEGLLQRNLPIVPLRVLLVHETPPQARDPPVSDARRSRYRSSLRDMQISCAMQFTLRQAEHPIDPHDPRAPRVELQRDVTQRNNHDVPERRAAALMPSLAHTRAGPTTTTDCAGVELNARTGITPLITVQNASRTARHASGGCSLMSQASVGATGKIAGP